MRRGASMLLGDICKLCCSNANLNTPTLTELNEILRHGGKLRGKPRGGGDKPSH